MPEGPGDEFGNPTRLAAPGTGKLRRLREAGQVPLVRKMFSSLILRLVSAYSVSRLWSLAGKTILGGLSFWANPTLRKPIILPHALCDSR